MQSIGKILVVIAVLLLLAGAAFWIGGRLGLGSLPGDLKLHRGGWTLYIPIATSIILSILLTVVLNLLLRLWRH